jgi:Glycosyltransferase family 87
MLGVRALVVLATCAAAAWIAHRLTASGDYELHNVVGGDNAAPAIDALVRGHLARMASVQPLMGLVSLLWRAPFAGAVIRLGGASQLVYQAGALACLLPVAGLALWLLPRVETRTHAAAALLALAVILAGPVTNEALQYGHPEEVLATVLAAGAVITAGQDRPGWAAALLGLAIGTKPWAALVLPCVLLAAPLARRRLRDHVTFAIRAAAIAVPAVALLPVVDLRAFRTSEQVIGGLNATTPLSLWWPIRGRSLGYPGVPMNLLPLSLTRTDLAAVTLTVVAGTIWFYGRRLGHGHLPAVDGLALLALVGLVRCLADPAPVTYYFAPVVIPLALWEAGSLRRPPIVAVLASAALDLLEKDQAAIVAGHSPFGISVLNLFWIAGAAALVIYLARHVFLPDRHNGHVARAVPTFAPAAEQS